ncbi:hypothetical protein PHMEG_00023432, partial [Phytophthora megakarya]
MMGIAAYAYKIKWILQLALQSKSLTKILQKWQLCKPSFVPQRFFSVNFMHYDTFLELWQLDLISFHIIIVKKWRSYFDCRCMPPLMINVANAEATMVVGEYIQLETQQLTGLSLAGHQTGAWREFLNSVSGYIVRSPRFSCFIKALSALSKVLNEYHFKMVRRQWNYNIVYGNDWNTLIPKMVYDKCPGDRTFDI